VPLSDRFEHGGVLLNCGGRFTYTAAVSAHDRRSLSYRITIPNVCVLAGLYHTHPALPLAEFFSDDDARGAKRFGVPSFIGLVADGSVFRLDPEAASPLTVRRRMGDDALIRGVLIPSATATVATTATN
jgi:uncharacterized protein DUF4329